MVGVEEEQAHLYGVCEHSYLDLVLFHFLFGLCQEPVFNALCLLENSE